jgi:hypothetical protein
MIATHRFPAGTMPLLACAAASILLVLFLVGCGPSGALAAYTLGFVFVVPVPAAIVGSAILAAWPLVRRVVPNAPLSLRIATSGAIGLGLQSLLVLAVSLAGWINHLTAIAIVFVPGAIGAIHLVMARRHAQQTHQPAATGNPSTTPRSAWILLAIAPFTAISLVAGALVPGILWKPDPFPYDVTSYHLQIPRQWFDAGRITPLNENIFSFFPHGAETLDLLSMEIAGDPWTGMYGAQFLSSFEMMLMLAAIYGGVVALAKSGGLKEEGHAILAATLATVSAASVPWVTMLSCVAYVESLMLLYTAAATAWALLAVVGSGDTWRCAAVAGVLAGFACGTKYTAAPMTLIPLAIAIAGAAWKARGPRNRISIKQAIGVPLALLACGTLVFSPWLIRDLIWTGNPVFPLALHTLGSHNLTQAQVERFEIAHAPVGDQATLFGRVQALLSQVVFWWQYGYVVVPIGCAAAVARLRHAGGIFLAILLASIAVVWLFFTHLEGRFFVPIIPTAALAFGAWVVFTPSQDQRLTVFAIAVTAFAVMLGAAVTAAQFDEQSRLSTQSLYFVADSDPSDLLMAMHGDDLKPAADAVKKPDFKLALIGDAQAFLYPMPSKNLLYRNVFDVDIPPGVSLVDGWLGQSVESLRRQGYWVEIDPAELRRLAATYHRLPAPTGDIMTQDGRQLLPPFGPSTEPPRT